MKQENPSKLVGAGALVLALAASLWSLLPVKALTIINITDPLSTILQKLISTVTTKELVSLTAPGLHSTGILPILTVPAIVVTVNIC